MHAGKPYDPVKAHEYYMRKRKLKGRRKGQTEPPPGKAKATPGPAPNQKTAAEKLAEIKRKLDLLTRGSTQGPGDFQSRTKAEKVAAAKKKQEAVSAAGREVNSARKDLSDLNQSLKQKISSKASPEETAALKQKIKEAQTRLDDLVEKQKSLNNAT